MGEGVWGRRYGWGWVDFGEGKGKGREGRLGGNGWIVEGFGRGEVVRCYEWEGKIKEDKIWRREVGRGDG